MPSNKEAAFNTRWCCPGLVWLLGLITTAIICAPAPPALPESPRARAVIERHTPLSENELAGKDLTLGAPLFIRIFKASSELEVWVKNGERFARFKTYPICYFSGEPGSKLRQGDGQSPEGFYDISPNRLNPWSRFHLSMNIGFPNAYDRHHRRTGDYLMIHGDCVSIGCYAMTNPAIEEIYTLVYKSLENGQPSVPVHIFPFRMTAENLDAQKENTWYGFWKNLGEGYHLFEEKGVPPDVRVEEGRYAFD